MKKACYTRPAKPRRVVPKTRERGIAPPAPINLPVPVVVARETECHVTRPEYAAIMADALGNLDGCGLLEPEAGTGNLVQAALDAGACASQITAIERHPALVGRMRATLPEGLDVIEGCFLAFAGSTQRRFDRILMNPPFRQVRQHVAAALSLLQGSQERPGILVALVPITYQHPEASTLEILPADAFATAKVHTKIIRFVMTG